MLRPIGDQRPRRRLQQNARALARIGGEEQRLRVERQIAAVQQYAGEPLIVARRLQQRAPRRLIDMEPPIGRERAEHLALAARGEAPDDLAVERGAAGDGDGELGRPVLGERAGEPGVNCRRKLEGDARGAPALVQQLRDDAGRRVGMAAQFDRPLGDDIGVEHLDEAAGERLELLDIGRRMQRTRDELVDDLAEQNRLGLSPFAFASWHLRTNRNFNTRSAILARGH